MNDFYCTDLVIDLTAYTKGMLKIIHKNGYVHINYNKKFGKFDYNTQDIVINIDELKYVVDRQEKKNFVEKLVEILRDYKKELEELSDYDPTNSEQIYDVIDLIYYLTPCTLEKYPPLYSYLISPIFNFFKYII